MTLKELEKRLKKEPENLGLRVQVAGLMREVGRSTEAVELYRSVALAYRDQGRNQQAIAVCKAILEIAPDDERCIALLSTLTGRSTPSIPSISPPPPPPPTRAGPSQPPPAASRSPTAPPPTQPAKTPSQPPKTSSRPPAVIVIPPKASTPGARAASEITGTPAPAPARPPTEPAPPSPVTSRLPLEPPVRKSPSPPPTGEPKRRSSLEETPLPKPVPHHIHDPTGKSSRVDPEEVDTNPTANPRSRTSSSTGLAEAARKISGKMIDDVSRPLDTRPVRRIKSDELQKISEPPPTVEHERISDDAITDVPGGDEELTTPRDRIDPDDL